MYVCMYDIYKRYTQVALYTIHGTYIHDTIVGYSIITTTENEIYTRNDPIQTFKHPASYK